MGLEGTLPFLRHGVVGIERLSGSFTNLTYKVTVESGVYVLRLAGEGTAEYVDRASEEYNVRVAAAVGVGAEVLYFDPGGGTMLSRFIEGVTMDGERFRRDSEAIAHAARTLARIHRSGWTFRRRFDVFQEISRYMDLLYKLGAPLPEDYEEVEQDAEAVRKVLEATPVPLVPCHNDPWPGNYVYAVGRMYLVDWEFSGMNDPSWDLADLSVEAGFTPEQDLAMLETYRGGPVPPALYSRLELYKPLSDLLWTLWALVRHAGGRPADDDFLDYARVRFERCKRGMDGSLGRHLAVVDRDASRARLRPAPARDLPLSSARP